ncbi:hypothetical protein [Rubrivirga marina]|uniref:Uncharacterized protein n=1 Tax=Rubrivirga marina TaxID=1196024 RepID=A0A271J5I3_9BACT|nr:hypothetical protein [Rubrivirga marina]PAP78225.1 hypothetical protein BSZ37_18230 [Rubrivirga marina]
MTWPWSRRPARDVPLYVDTPAGLLSADGTHYRTTEPLLREYAREVVEAVGLGPLLLRAGVWLRSPQTVAVLLLPALLLALPWWGALGTVLLLYALWSAAAPGLVLPGAIPALKVMEQPVVQGLIYIGVLSAFASAGMFAAVWTGVAGFVAFRLGLVDNLLGPIVRPIQASLHPLPPADQTLRTLIVREALRRGLSLPGIDAIETRVREFWKRERR